MKRCLQRIGWTLATLGLAWSTGCTPMAEGVRDGISDGFSAALAALIETPIVWAIEQALNGA